MHPKPDIDTFADKFNFLSLTWSLMELSHVIDPLRKQFSSLFFKSFTWENNFLVRAKILTKLMASSMFYSWDDALSEASSHYHFCLILCLREVTSNLQLSTRSWNETRTTTQKSQIVSMHLGLKLFQNECLFREFCANNRNVSNFEFVMQLAKVHEHHISGTSAGL